MQIQQINRTNQINKINPAFTARVKVNTQSIDDMIDRIYANNTKRVSRRIENNIRTSIDNATRILSKKYDDSSEFEIEGDFMFKQLLIVGKKQIDEIPKLPEAKKILTKILRKLFPPETPQPSRIVSSEQKSMDLSEISCDNIVKIATKTLKTYPINDAIRRYNATIKAYVKEQ